MFLIKIISPCKSLRFSNKEPCPPGRGPPWIPQPGQPAAGHRDHAAPFSVPGPQDSLRNLPSFAPPGSSPWCGMAASTASRVSSTALRQSQLSNNLTKSRFLARSGSWLVTVDINRLRRIPSCEMQSHMSLTHGLSSD